VYGVGCNAGFASLVVAFWIALSTSAVVDAGRDVW